MNKNWIISFLAIMLIAIFGIFNFESLSLENVNPENAADIAWMLTASCLVFFMTPGLSFFYGGMVSQRNIISTMLQSFIALGLISILWVVVGFSISFGDSYLGLIGDPTQYFMFNNIDQYNETLGLGIPLLLFALFQLKFAIITPAITTGSFAERINFSAYLIFMCLFCLIIYCPLAHWTWHPDGFLHQWGVLDFAGGAVVHISSGFAALAGAIALGRRKKHRQEENPANTSYVLLGTGMLWFGWFGFNSGSALGANADAIMAFATTNTASAISMFTWIVIEGMKGNKVKATHACIGAVVGLVVITPAAGFVTIGQSLFIGFIGALFCNHFLTYFRRFDIDDTLDVFACHGMGGIVGLLLTGIFAKDVGLIYGETETFINHIYALIIISIFTFVGSYILYKITALIVPIRVTEEIEEQGLDRSLHGEYIN
jgi:Amt family ammonium transporter